MRVKGGGTFRRPVPHLPIALRGMKVRGLADLGGATVSSGEAKNVGFAVRSEFGFWLPLFTGHATLYW